MNHPLDNTNTKPTVDLFDADADATRRIDRTIEGAFDFIRAVVEDASLNDSIPTGAEIVLIHDDGPELTAASRRLGEEIRRCGHQVYEHRVRAKVWQRTASNEQAAR